MVSGSLSPGPADRLRRVLGELDVRSPRLTSVAVQESPEQLPTLWRRLLERLGARFSVGADGLSLAPAREGIGAGSDLDLLQRRLLGQETADGPIVPRADGSLIWVRAHSEVTLARAIARCMASARRSGKRVTVIARKGARVLDEALGAEDEPVTGVTPRSAARPIPQVLHLALRLLWEPLDPQHLLEFLIHPVCPVPRGMARELIQALKETPGMFGPRWMEALSAAEAVARKCHGADPTAFKEALSRLESARREWLEIERFDPRTGAPGEQSTQSRCHSSPFHPRSASQPRKP